MAMRKNFLPRTTSNAAAALFLSVCIPVTFWFQFSIVIPELHDPGSVSYLVTFVTAIILLVSVNSNMLAIMLCDTSIEGRIIIPPKNSPSKKLWKICFACDSFVPPRSWHCQTCNTCILKRDHHCIFTGCCIGHYNHRYFFMLVIFIFLGSCYASVYNSIFVWHNHADEYGNSITILKMVMPLLFLLKSPGNGYLVIYELNLIAFAISGVLLIYHSRLILQGNVTHERKTDQYNLGWKKNIEIVFGKHWYIAWISPLIRSELPYDGINWDEAIINFKKN